MTSLSTGSSILYEENCLPQGAAGLNYNDVDKALSITPAARGVLNKWKPYDYFTQFEGSSGEFFVFL